jgi:hypothetical protein
MTDYFGNLTVLNGAAAGAADDEYEEEVEYHLRQILAKDEAKRRYDAQNRAEVGLPPVCNLTALLAEPDTETVYRIEGLAPAGSRVMLAAQAKSGKTHLAGNLVRCLVDGDPFLGRFRVNGQAQRVAIVDTELSQNMLRRWLREQGILNTDRVDVIALRGRVGAFNLLNSDRRAEWAEVLRDVDFLILDCLRPVLDALVLDEHRDAGKFLVAFDALLAQAGITDALLVHHMGHTGDRARGDSRLQDWPDVTWRILRAKDDPDSDRFFTAYGRDVEVPEGRLDFDPTTRRLTYTDGSRKADTRQAARDQVLGDIVGILAQHLAEGNDDPMSRNDILTAMEGYSRSARTVDPALDHGVIQGVLTKTNGPRRSHLYTLANPCTVCHHPVADLMARTHPDCDTNHD